MTGWGIGIVEAMGAWLGFEGVDAGCGAGPGLGTKYWSEMKIILYFQQRLSSESLNWYKWRNFKGIRLTLFILNTFQLTQNKSEF